MQLTRISERSRQFMCQSTIVFLTLTSLAFPLAFEKEPGATNPRINAGEDYLFLCTPLSSKIAIDSRGTALSNKRKLGILPTNVGAGFYLRYAECFVMGNEVVIAYEESNGEDAGALASRCKLDGKSCSWNLDFGGAGLGAPKLEGNSLYLPVNGIKFEIDVKSGKVRNTSGRGCIMVSHRDSNAKQTRDSHGPTCKETQQKKK